MQVAYIVNMKTIKLPKQVKQNIVEKYDMSPNQAIKTMLKNTKLSKSKNLDGDINIKIDEDVADLLKELRAYPSESYASIILRLLNE